MEDILREEQATLQHISRIVTNLKKKGIANIDSHAVEVRLKKLEKLWSDYETLHNELMSLSYKVEYQKHS
ncbi:hypothetical protein WN55_07877 [Dufourea novaeangliae]|nr:hypothetical protein WN55_07877 [Dufourea novaeangliae]